MLKGLIWKPNKPTDKNKLKSNKFNHYLKSNSALTRNRKHP